MLINNLHFLNPIYLTLLYFILFYFICYIIYIIFIFKNKDFKNNSFLNIKESLKKTFKLNICKYIFKLGIIISILILYIIILANPNILNKDKIVKKDGIDIVLILDISASMLAEDLSPSRLESAKNMINKFITKIKTDRIGLIVYSGKPVSSIPLTFDYNIIKEVIDGIKVNIKHNIYSGTATGDALLMSINLFNKNLAVKGNLNSLNKDNKNIKEREKIVILLTDGDSRNGTNPFDASKFLKEKNIKVYTVGIGAKGGELKDTNGNITKIPPLNISELQEISKITGGYFFKASDNKTLDRIFNKLGDLTTQEFKYSTKYKYVEKSNFFIRILLLLLVILLFIELRRVKCN